MHNGKLPTSGAQLFYFADDHPSMPSWFKGMEVIICEWGYGQNRAAWLPSALTSIVPQVALIAAVGGSVSHSQILKVNSHNSRSSLKAVGTFATSTQSTTAS